jgi:hypothetical protein
MADLNIENGLDQSVVLSKDDTLILDQIDIIVEKGAISGDPSGIMNYGRSLRRNMQVQGIALAKLLAKSEEHWQACFSHTIEGTFEDYAVGELHLSNQTVRKYINLWRSVFENIGIPAAIRGVLMGKSTRSLILLTAAAREGSIAPEDWKEVAEATTGAEITDIVQRARGRQTSSINRIDIVIDMHTGVLTAWFNDVASTIGHLNITEDEDPITLKAIERIIRTAGIRETA